MNINLLVTDLLPFVTLIYCVPKKGRLTKINALYFLQVTGLFFARF